ncbi:MAG: hypothetical protein KDA78_14260 [Planctomycetaceae bacterium]|nr:hypothetical protein [Planctomycetaceae bacterium]
MSNSDSTFLPSAEIAVGAPRGTRRGPKKPTPEAVKLEAPPEQVDESWQTQVGNVRRSIVRWLHSAIFAGYSFSLLFHIVLLLAMSLVIFPELIEDPFIQSGMESTEDSAVFDQVVDVRIDVPAGDISQNQLMESAINIEHSTPDAQPVTRSVEDSLDSLLNKEGDQGAGGSLLVVPPNTKTFSKGSFTVWTVPNDPKPGQDYKIMILVKLPSRVERYRATDLAGIVIGTDGYRQPIPGPELRRGNVYLPIEKQQVLFPPIEVPGAASRVRDTIEVRSTTLKEQQRIQIEF